MKVLVAEDDLHIRNGLVEILSAEGYSTVAARDGDEALRLFASEEPDFVCLDIMMPGTDGYEVCKKIRRVDDSVPIIFLSARSEEIDKVLGLELGADDFIMKPFGVREVVARIRAVARRTGRSMTVPGDTFKMGDLEVIPEEQRARRGEQLIDLGLRDVKILELFYERRGTIVDRDTFFDRCWGLDHAPNSRTLDQHISQLRKRVEKDPRNPQIIRTVYGAGYRFEE